MKNKWKKVTLFECCDRPAYGLNAAAIPFDGKHKYIRITDISDVSHRFLMGNVTSPSFFSDDYRVVSGDILFARTGASVGKTYCYSVEDGELYYAGFLIRFHVKDSFCARFVFYQTLTPEYKSWVAKVSMRTGQPGINSQEYSKYQFCIPDKLENQRRIASILMSCDEVIEQTEKAISKYRDIKAGMLQDLFTRGLDANGKLRPKPEDAPELYKDSLLGRIPKEWNVKKIGEMFVFKNGLNKGKEFFGYGVPIVNYMDVYKREWITPQMLRGRVFLSLQETQNFSVCSGDVFFTRTSETPEEVGLASVIEGSCQDIVFSGFVLRAHPISDDFLDCYKRYCFRINSLRKKIVADCTYTTRALTNGTKLSEYCIAVPTHKEQQRIANRLNSIDTQIEAEEQTLEKYRSIKLGLMKRLLTPPEGALEA